MTGTGQVHEGGGARTQPGRPDELDRLRADNADYRALFDVQWDRMAEATARWRSESPDLRALIMPDLGALLTWLIERLPRNPWLQPWGGKGVPQVLRWFST